MLTIDDALILAEAARFADTVKALLAAEVRRLRDEVKRLTGSLAREEATVLVMTETAQNQQKKIYALWAAIAKAAEVMGIDPMNDQQLPRLTSTVFIATISQIVAERDAALAALKEAQKQEPVAWLHDKEGRVDVCHDSVKKLWLKVGQQQNTQSMREVVPCRVEHYNIPLYARPVPAAPTVAVPAVPEECGHLHQPGEDMNIEELKRLAEAATPGPWQSGWGWIEVCSDEAFDAGVLVSICNTNSRASWDDLAYIAAANPAAMLELIDYVEYLRGKNREHFDACTGCDEELKRVSAQRDELLATLRMAVNQNEHDMILTGDELRRCRAAIAKEESKT